MSFEERLKYYLGDLYNQEKVQISFKLSVYQAPI